MKESIITILLSILGVEAVFSQTIPMEETLSYINQKLAPHSELTVDRGILVSRYFKNGQIIREDQVMCKDLDIASINYDEASGMFFVNCKNNGKCVDRQMFIRKIQRDYSRISFPVKLDQKAANGLINATRHMLKMVVDSKYQSTEPFE